MARLHENDDAPTAPRGYAKVPNAVARNPELSGEAVAMYATLVSYMRPDFERPVCWVGQDRLAAERGVSLSTVRRALNELKAAGLIEVERTGRRQTNVYWLIEGDRSDSAYHSEGDRSDSAYHSEGDGSDSAYHPPVTGHGRRGDRSDLIPEEEPVEEEPVQLEEKPVQPEEDTRADARGAPPSALSNGDRPTDNGNGGGVGVEPGECECEDPEARWFPPNPKLERDGGRWSEWVLGAPVCVS